MQNLTSAPGTLSWFSWDRESESVFFNLKTLLMTSFLWYFEKIQTDYSKLIISHVFSKYFQLCRLFLLFLLLSLLTKLLSSLCSRVTVLRVSVLRVTTQFTTKFNYICYKVLNHRVYRDACKPKPENNSAWLPLQASYIFLSTLYTVH